jgi:hypothetical protein
MSENQKISAQVDAVWLSLCQRLQENVTRINLEVGENYLHLDLGNVIGLVNVWAYDRERNTRNEVEFQLSMNTGGLMVSYKENMRRSQALIEVIRDKNADTFLYRFGSDRHGEWWVIREFVDRVLERWLETIKTGSLNQYRRSRM